MQQSVTNGSFCCSLLTCMSSLQAALQTVTQGCQVLYQEVGHLLKELMQVGSDSASIVGKCVLLSFRHTCSMMSTKGNTRHTKKQCFCSV